MVTVVQAPDRFASLGNFGSALGDVLGMQQQKKQKEQGRAELQQLSQKIPAGQNIPPEMVAQITIAAQKAGVDPKQYFESLKSNRPSTLERMLGGQQIGSQSPLMSQLGNNQMDQNPIEMPYSNSTKQQVAETAQRLSPKKNQLAESFTDEQLLMLAASPNKEDQQIAEMLLKQKQTDRSTFVSDRDYHSKLSDKYAQDISVERENQKGLDSSIKDFEFALQSGDIGPYSKDYFGKILGKWFPGLTTPEGALANRASKEFLLADTSRIAAKGLNVFMEQRLASTYAEIGKTKEANSTLIAGFKMKAKNMNAKIKAYDELSRYYEEKLGYVPRNIDRLVDNAIQDEVEANAFEAAREMRQIQESTKKNSDLSKDINKKVPPDTPLTQRNAQIFFNKFGKDAEKRAKERGYITTVPSGESVFNSLILGDPATPKDGQLTNSEIVQQMQLEPRSIPQDVAETDIIEEPTEDSYARAIGMGAGQGVLDIASTATAPVGLLSSLISSPLPESAKQIVSTPGQQARSQRLLDPNISEAEFIRRASEGEDLLPEAYTPRGRTLLEEQLSAPRSSPMQESARRGVRNLPYLAGGLGLYSATAGRDIAGQYAAEGAQAIGLGETGQNIADIAVGFVPGKGYVPSRKTADQAKYLKDKGFSEEQISLALRSESTGGNIPLKFAKKSGKVEELVTSTKEKFSDVFESLYEQGGAKKEINRARVNKFSTSVEKVLEKAPADVEKAIREDYSKFLNSDQTGADLINFYRAINKKIGQKKQLVAIKPMIQQELQLLDKDLAKQFNVSNDLYRKFSTTAEKLSPSWFTQVKEQSLPWRMFGGLLSLPFEGGFLLTEAIGETALTKLMTAMVTNPRYQNLVEKTVASINQGNVKGVEKLANQILTELSKDSPEAYEQIMGINEEKLQLK